MKIRTPFLQSRRDAWVEVNLGHIEHNIIELKKFKANDAKILAVVKADAYGHDATMVAPTLLASGIDMFGVASVDEGLQLRKSGINAPILVLGSVPEWAFVSATENDISLSIFTNEHIEACKMTFEKLNIRPKVHIKVDTGMNRIGINHTQAVEFVKKVADTNEIDLKGIFTHLACAEDLDSTMVQNSKWMSVIENLECPDLIKHAVNTSGLISYPDMHYDMVRAGIGIYGLAPDYPSCVNKQPELKQAISLKGRIVHIHEAPADSGISYGYTHKTNTASKIATIPVGYADGVSRSLSNKIYGLINGKKVRQIGNITMDQMMFDISDIDDANTGDVITLLGQSEDQFISINQWAEILGTINYELTCRLKVRLPRVYTR